MLGTWQISSPVNLVTKNKKNSMHSHRSEVAQYVERGTTPKVSVLTWFVHYSLFSVSVLICIEARDHPYFSTFFLALGFLSVARASLKSFSIFLQTFVLPGISVGTTYISVWCSAHARKSSSSNVLVPRKAHGVL